MRQHTRSASFNTLGLGRSACEMKRCCTTEGHTVIQSERDNSIHRKMHDSMQEENDMNEEEGVEWLPTIDKYHT